MPGFSSGFLVDVAKHVDEALLAFQCLGRLAGWAWWRQSSGGGCAKEFLDRLSGSPLSSLANCLFVNLGFEQWK